MSARAMKNGPEEAADTFYGQSERSFEEQLKSIGATDPRLINAFKRTRERYLEQKRPARGQVS